MQDALRIVLAALSAHGCEARRSGEGWSSRCPHHEDHRPSLMTSEGEKAVVMHCHSGCSTEDIVSDLGLTMSALFYEQSGKRREIEATYAYRNEQGELEWEQVRFAGKRFASRRPNGAGGWEWRKGRSILYRLPELLDAITRGETIYVVEGEKDVEAIMAAGGVATCNPGGAGKWLPEFGKILDKAEHVRIVADRDMAGYAHAEQVAASLNGTSYELLMARHGKDASDHLQRHSLLEFLPLELAPSEPQPEPEPQPKQKQAKPLKGIRRRSIADYRAERVTWLPGFQGLIPMSMLSLIAGRQGDGKSLFGAYLAAAASQRGERVVIAAAEDSIPHTLKPYLMAMNADQHLIETVEYVEFADEREFVSGLKLPEHEHLLYDAIEDFKPQLMIIDPIGSFMGKSINVWKDSEVRQALDPLTMMAREFNVAILLLAHLNKATGATFLDRISNSGAFSQIVRSAMLWARDPEDPEGEDGYRRMLLCDKMNVGAKGRGQVFEIKPTSVRDEDDEVYGTARMEWVSETRRSAGDVLSQRSEKPPGPAMASAMLMLQEILRDGQLMAAEVEERRKAWPDPISPATMHRAAVRLNIEHVSQGYQKGTAWRLPTA